MTGTADAAGTRLVWCYGVLGLDFFHILTNVRLVDGGLGGRGLANSRSFFQLPVACARCCCIVIGLQRLVLHLQR